MMTAPLSSIWRLMLLWLAAIWAVPAAAQAPTNIRPELIAEQALVAPGSTVTLALQMTPAPRWHGYWKNGGDAGFGLSIDWTLPDGVSVGEFAYPVPEPLRLFGLMNHVYKSPYALLAPLRVADSVAPGSDLTLSGLAQWLACTDAVCVPERAIVSVRLKAGDPRARATPDPRFDAWRAALPPVLDRPGRWERRGTMLRAALPVPAAMDLPDPHLFVATRGLIDYGAVQSFSRSGDWLIVEAAAKGDARGPAEVLLRLDGARGLMVRLEGGRVPAAGTKLAAPSKIDWRLFTLAFGGAVLGGLLLNLMPCVFPILSLKALALARAGGDMRAAKGEALAYLAGAVTVALALGVLLLGLRAGGAEVGWAFQLQHPASLALLLLLTLAITANLLGLFELRGFGGGQAAASAGGAKGGFATGALAAFVATPCSGPFMGAALGATLVLPEWAALPIFGGLGLGLALPFVAIAYTPALRRRLPRPGAWMAAFRKWMALPMALTALALAVLLWRQLDGGAQYSAVSANGKVWSEDALARARASGQPVFVNFTADWCITCKVNEQTSISRAEVQAALGRAGVVQLTADWTRADPAITRALAAQGRNSLPLYLWYAPGAATPEILPQILTPAMLIDRAER